MSFRAVFNFCLIMYLSKTNIHQANVYFLPQLGLMGEMINNIFQVQAIEWLKNDLIKKLGW